MNGICIYYQLIFEWFILNPLKPKYILRSIHMINPFWFIRRIIKFVFGLKRWKITSDKVVEEDQYTYNVHFWYYVSECYSSHVFRETTFWGASVNTKNEIFGRTHDSIFDKADGLFRHVAKCKEISTKSIQTSTHHNFDQRQGEIIRSCNWSAWRETRLKCIEDYFLVS